MLQLLQINVYACGMCVQAQTPTMEHTSSAEGNLICHHISSLNQPSSHFPFFIILFGSESLLFTYTIILHLSFHDEDPESWKLGNCTSPIPVISRDFF